MISLIIIPPSTLLEPLVFWGFFSYYITWLYFLAFLFLISTASWFYFLCDPFLPYSSRTQIRFPAVTSLFYSLPINFLNPEIAFCCFRKSMFSLVFLESSSFYSTKALYFYSAKASILLKPHHFVLPQ